MVTDYDCWHAGYEAVTVDQVIHYLNQNVQNAQKIIDAAVRDMPKERTCKCASALAHALMTDPKKISPRAKKRLRLLISKYVK
jgi:5'-methylthioadenosine phosphorylase